MAKERAGQERQDHERAVRAVVEAAVNNFASWKVAVASGLDAEVCEQWVDALWNGLRDNLDGEERILAILALINDTAAARATALRQEPSVHRFGAVDRGLEAS